MLLKLKSKPTTPWWSKKQHSWANYDKYFDSLDPSDWKQHDMYRIIRLENKRFSATPDEILKSYRTIARRYHPDKRPGGDRHYPSVIKASSVLLDLSTKRSFDSVDPAFDDSIPSETDARDQIFHRPFDRNVFFDIFRPVFERNSHWSIEQPVPCIGDWYTPDECIDNFYRFWHNFDSWREYSFLDKEDKSHGQDRYERKAIEKGNREERKKRRAAELQRISLLVTIAKRLDPRLQLREQREQRERMKKAEEKQKQRHELEVKKRNQRKIDQLKEMETLRHQKELDDQMKKLVVQLSLEQSRFRQIAIQVMPKKEKIIDQFIQVSWPNNITDKMQICKTKTSTLSDLNELLGEYSKSSPEKIKSKLASLLAEFSSETNGSQTSEEWSVDELEMLIKAIRLYPPGSKDRWVVIHRHMLDHGMPSNRSAKDVMVKARRIKEGERFQGHTLETRDTRKTDDPTTHTDSTTKPWSANEQRLLEQGLRQIPASDIERWDKIAELVKGRTKAECLKR